ncbi:hypothetical protein [Phenylobacterium sp.]|uniref:hypothetical protein n=1 Tax=Phenylobacterium sp. TaxID=1871053 RepID=UPI00301D65E6
MAAGAAFVSDPIRASASPDGSPARPTANSAPGLRVATFLVLLALLALLGARIPIVLIAVLALTIRLLLLLVGLLLLARIVLLLRAAGLVVLVDVVLVAHHTILPWLWREAFNDPRH